MSSLVPTSVHPAGLPRWPAVLSWLRPLCDAPRDPSLTSLFCPPAGRELAKFMASVQAMAYGSHNAELSSAAFRAMVEAKVGEHAKRRSFIQAGGGDAPY